MNLNLSEIQPVDQEAKLSSMHFAEMSDGDWQLSSDQLQLNTKFIRDRHETINNHRKRVL